MTSGPGLPEGRVVRQARDWEGRIRDMMIYGDVFVSFDGDEVVYGKQDQQ